MDQVPAPLFAEQEKHTDVVGNLGDALYSSGAVYSVVNLA
jgi:hypothetical protein